MAAIFKVTPRTVWRWANDGRLGRVRIGTGVSRFTTASVEALISADKDHEPVISGPVEKKGDHGAHSTS